MNNRQSYLDSMNAGRRRRPTTSLDQLNETLDELEQRIGRSQPQPERPGSLRGHSQRLAGEASYYDAYEAPRERPARQMPREQHTEGYRRAPARAEAPGIAHELNSLREELRQQMNTGLRREFSTLKTDIERAVRSSAPASQVAELGVEFERLAALIHKLAQKGDDRQITLLRLEMEEVKAALGKLAREDTVHSFDRRWQELDQRWTDIASQVSNPERGHASDAALNGLSARLEQIADTVKMLPTSNTLRALEEEVKALAVTVDRIAHRQDRIAPDTLAAIEDRLDELSRAVAASVPVAQPSVLDTEPFDRIEARISSLARQIGEVAEDNPGVRLGDQLAALSRRVEDIAHRVDLPDSTIERLAGQIDIISRKLDEAPQAPDVDDVFRSLEDRFASLSSMLEQRHEDALAQGNSLFRDLERRLEEVSEHMIAAAPAAPNDSHLIEAMDARFAELATRLERQAVAAPADDRAIRELESRLEAISTRMESSVAKPGVDPELIRSLESQIAGLTAHIAKPIELSPEASTLLPRLDKIEQSLSANRQDVVEAARQAAEDAVRSFSGKGSDGLLVAGLVEDLKSLENLTRRSDDRNAKTFEAIHDTLLKIVERLGTVEAVATAPRHAQQFGLKDTPSLAPHDDTIPLESMASEPRVEADKGQKKRSAAAIAAEAAAAAARGEAEAASTDTGGKRLSMFGGLTRAFSGQKKASEKQDKEAPVLSDDADLPAALSASVDPIAPSVEIDAPLDPQIANRPLEPGSGAPDLNAIMKRVRDERGQPGRGADVEAAKSDFIAAARRAAQAAAAEAEVMKRAPADKPKSGSSLARLFKNRRKPVLMGVAAVLMALAALQFGSSLLGGNGDVAEAPAPATVETAEMPQVPAAPAIEMDETAASARVIEGDSARSMMALAPENPQSVTTEWLDAPAPLVAQAQPAQEEIAEIEAVPDATEEMLAEIPLEAGPAPLREAAAAGDPKALFEIGNRYAEGRGVTADQSMAGEWYMKAAEEGLAPAQYRVGNMYEKGIGVDRDIPLAKSFYEQAATQGNAGAMHNLAVLLAMGAGGTADNDNAARWFAGAAELGVTDSQFNLGILAAKGVGMKQDLEAAYKWFALVAKTGDKDAAGKRDEIGNALRPEQLENAKAATDLWRAKTPDAEANVVEVPESWGESNDVTASVDMKQAVRNIQHILNKNGYDAGSPDGVMGARTKTAIAAFQTANGMPATGEVNETLVRALLEKR